MGGEDTKDEWKHDAMDLMVERHTGLACTLKMRTAPANLVKEGGYDKNKNIKYEVQIGGTNVYQYDIFANLLKKRPNVVDPCLFDLMSATPYVHFKPSLSS